MIKLFASLCQLAQVWRWEISKESGRPGRKTVIEQASASRLISKQNLRSATAKDRYVYSMQGGDFWRKEALKMCDKSPA